jgi:hypothetical protein
MAYNLNLTFNQIIMKPQVPQEFTQAVDSRQERRKNTPRLARINDAPRNSVSYIRNPELLKYATAPGQAPARALAPRKRKPHEYEGEMVMQAPQGPRQVRGSEGAKYKSKMSAGPGYQSSPSDAWGSTPEAYEFDSRLQDLEDVKFELQNSGNYSESQLREIQRQVNSITEQRSVAFKDWYQKIKSQSPAKAQFNVYDARTGSSLSDTQLDNFHRNEAALYRQAGGSPIGGGGSSQNPYLMSEIDRSVFEDNSKYQTAIDNARKPKFGASNWNY